MQQNLLLLMGVLDYCFNKHLHEKKHEPCNPTSLGNFERESIGLF